MNGQYLDNGLPDPAGPPDPWAFPAWRHPDRCGSQVIPSEREPSKDAKLFGQVCYLPGENRWRWRLASGRPAGIEGEIAARRRTFRKSVYVE